MRIIYFTTALSKNEYNEYTKLWKISPNPSNQNFHNKLIRSLSINNKVEVISIRPFSKKLVSSKRLKKKEDIEGNITWHYLGIKRNKISRFFSIRKQALQIVKTIKEDVLILTDTINPNVLYNATRIGKKRHLKVIGICTDSPSNITSASRSYTLLILKLAKELSGYISLTSGLNDLFNEGGKPSLIIEGIIDEPTRLNNKNEYGKYLFFGGALLPRYGIYNLIEAFKKLPKTDLKLLICGHHGDIVKLQNAIKDNHNIIYLGTLDVDTVRDLESKSIANINPRPYSEDLDRYSIPSKTLEYFSSGRPTISVKNSKLMKNFSESAIWLKVGDVDSLYNGINLLLDLTPENQIQMGNKAKEQVYKLYSLDVVNEKLNDFLSTFID